MKGDKGGERWREMIRKRFMKGKGRSQGVMIGELV